VDEEAFGALYRRYRRAFFKIAASSVGPVAAQDVVHEVFTVVWSKRAEAPSGAEDLARWCFGILRNKVRQEVQRVQRKHHDSRFSADFEGDNGPPATDGDIADVIVARLVARDVWRSLSADDRELVRVAMAGLRGTDAAALLGISHEAYRRRVSRLRVRITQQTGEQHPHQGQPAGEGGGHA
jgi:RNA polymerase sigma-70 factor, ECF subfamily